MKQVDDVKDWIKQSHFLKISKKRLFLWNFNYLLWICSNISSSSLKKQLFEVSSIHMDKYLLPFKLSLFPTLNEQVSGAKKKEMKNWVKSESDKVVAEF